jgi:hypothetical protein
VIKAIEKLDNINNKSDIQTLCIKKGFTIINPELISIQLLMRMILQKVLELEKEKEERTVYWHLRQGR